MTSPPNTIRRGNSRFYVEPVTGSKVPSVTSVVGMLPKPAIAFWRGKKVAECAVEDIGVVVDFVTRGNPTAAIDHLKKAPDRSSGDAARIGTDVHDLCARLAMGEELGNVHPELAGFIQQYERFISDFEPGFLEVEATAWSETHGYAGTLDWVGTIDGEVVICDIKTGASGAWPEVALQLCAYANADHLIDAGGDRRPLPSIEAAAVLSLRPDRYDLYPVRLGDDVFDAFLALLRVFKWDAETSKTVLGKTPVDPINTGDVKT